MEAIKASTFTDARKAFILKQSADGDPVAEICLKARGASTGKRESNGLLPDELRRLKELEEMNVELKKLMEEFGS